MKIKTTLTGTLLALFALLTLNLPLSTAHAQGSLTPPGPPGATMLTLTQIEPRTPISSAPYSITNPGSYYLTHNLTVSTGDGIDINTNGVTLDLNGFTISSTAASATGNGILLNGGLKNVTIANGFIQGGVTNNGSGVYSGSGLANGIYYSGNSPVNVLVSRVSVSGCLDNGIYLFTADSTVVESCTVGTVGSYGIFASIIKSCSALDCGGNAIYGDQDSDCRGQSSGSGDGIVAVYTAQSCNGISSSGYGLLTGYVASGCSGYSSSGTGLSAFIANGCVGNTSTGTALSTTHNVNSYAY